MKLKEILHYISYLQYPIMLLAVFYVLKPYFNGFAPQETFNDLNNVLLFMGIAISFLSLQDTQKTQNKISKKIWTNPKKGRAYILLIAAMTLIILISGLSLYFIDSNHRITELSIGMIVLGISMIGLLKTAVEMFENHRTDKISK